MKNNLPLISCLCVTRGKPICLRRAIDCFTAQSYPNKELVIVYEDDDLPTKTLMSSVTIADRLDIVMVEVNALPKTSLGELRNIGIHAATGEFICQWDDDDWYHMDRLKEQYNNIMQHDSHGVVLTQWLVFNSLNGKAYISNKRNWEGSILCRKSILLSKPYENKHIGEDTSTIEYLADIDALHFMNNVPGLYVYVYHGSNTWNFEHWNYIFMCSTELPSADAIVVADILNGKYDIPEASSSIDLIMEKQYPGKS